MLRRLDTKAGKITDGSTGGDMLDLYSDYLLAGTRKAAAAGLPELADGAISHG
jgi:hypothetical protein